MATVNINFATQNRHLFCKGYENSHCLSQAWCQDKAGSSGVGVIDHDLRLALLVVEHDIGILKVIPPSLVYNDSCLEPAHEAVLKRILYQWRN